MNRKAMAVAACTPELTWCWRAASASGELAVPTGYERPYGSNPFAPSNATTTTGRFISQA